MNDDEVKVTGPVEAADTKPEPKIESNPGFDPGPKSKPKPNRDPDKVSISTAEYERLLEAAARLERIDTVWRGCRQLPETASKSFMRKLSAVLGGYEDPEGE